MTQSSHPRHPPRHRARHQLRPVRAAGQFVAPRRELGAGLARVYVYWSQVEPRPGPLRLDGGRRAAGPAVGGRGAVAHGLLQLAVGHPDADRLPASVARPRRRRLPPFRARAGGALPRPGPLLAVQQRAEQRRPALGRHRRRVRRPARGLPPGRQGADPSAAVVLGGCGYDVLSSPPGGPARAFFDEVLAVAGASFDLFDVHLYDDPRADPGAHRDRARDDARARLRAAGGRRRVQRARRCSSSPSSTACSSRRWRPRSPTATTARCRTGELAARPRPRRPSAAR